MHRAAVPRTVLASLIGAVGVGCLIMAALALGDRPAASAEEDAPAPTSVPASTSLPVGTAVPTEAPLIVTVEGTGGPDTRWIVTISERTGIPERALVAYTEAARRVAEESPRCGLGWNTLAGIGAVESDHGRIHGASLTAAGIASPAIIGPALNGNGFAAIPDTDGGTLDGDTVWDRAVGPMQFIPDTWRRYGTGNIHSIDDAALAAGRYLCAAGTNLRDPDGWRRAVAAYNNTHDYAVAVSERAHAYARADRD
ncbi:hypothetical protein M2390_003089 [Mycetocola sp. BIGb0189]|uniref:lytic transglycosylase domain-containing protein n=1 Tax=Mycetocola sp. BIGb0189 TaxID=2940604 RepID=UPI002168107C|nr:hypothetical protein [Mycetocola sp. BIGb0189]MCS4277873.1 hypothetical protein [Mycetocola sp. BIGb0189]